MTMAWTVEAHYFDLGAPGPVPSAHRWPHALGLWLAVGAAHAGVLMVILNMPTRIPRVEREIIQADLIQPPVPLPARPAPRPESPKPMPKPVPKRPPEARPAPPREAPAVEPAPVPEIKPAEPVPILAAPAPVGDPPPTSFVVPVSTPVTSSAATAPGGAETDVGGGTAGGSAPPAPAQPPLVLPVYSAAYLENPPPAYPPTSRQRRESGRVLLRVFVSASGRSERVEVKVSSGFERLDHAARETVATWRFVPARRGADPVAACVQIPIVFVL
jgi:protein TonB